MMIIWGGGIAHHRGKCWRRVYPSSNSAIRAVFKSSKALKVGDIDTHGERGYCDSISDMVESDCGRGSGGGSFIFAETSKH
jgi:hypothetical protein